MNVDELDDTTLVITRLYPVPPERVFRAWTDPEDLKQWYAPVESWVVSFAEVDLRPGGGYRLEFGPPEGQHIVETGTYDEIDAPNLLVFTIRIQGQGSVESTQCRVELEQIGGNTRLTITEGPYSSRAVRDKHAGGWTHCFDLLQKVLTK